MRLAAGLWLCASCSRPFPWSNHFPTRQRTWQRRAKQKDTADAVWSAWLMSVLWRPHLLSLFASYCFSSGFHSIVFSLRRCVSRTELEGWGGPQPALSTISEPIDIMAIHKSNLIAPESKMCWFGSLREAELTESLFKLLMRTTDVEACTIKTDDCICQSSEAVP